MVVDLTKVCILTEELQTNALWPHVMNWPVGSRMHDWGQHLGPWRLRVDVWWVKRSTPLFFFFCEVPLFLPRRGPAFVARCSSVHRFFSPLDRSTPVQLKISSRLLLLSQSVPTHVTSVLHLLRLPLLVTSLVPGHNLRTQVGQSIYFFPLFFPGLLYRAPDQSSVR